MARAGHSDRRAYPAARRAAFPIPSSGCGIPATAAAYSLNVTVVPPGQLTYLTMWPTGQTMPTVSTLNDFSTQMATPGNVVANAAIVPAGSNGSVSVYVSDTSDVIIDVNGYFAPPGSGGLAFYPVTPCRVTDTRGNGKSGLFGPPSMAGGSNRSFPIPQGSCNVPSTAQAYSLNMTVVPPGQLTYLTAWPSGQSMPMVSTLNDFSTGIPAQAMGKVVANAAIVPAGTSGAVSVYASDTTDVIIDINGYFAPPGGSGALSFYTATPCRVADTRGNGFTGAFGAPSMGANATRTFPVPHELLRDSRVRAGLLAELDGPAAGTVDLSDDVAIRAVAAHGFHSERLFEWDGRPGPGGGERGHCAGGHERFGERFHQRPERRDYRH